MARKQSNAFSKNFNQKSPFRDTDTSSEENKTDEAADKAAAKKEKFKKFKDKANEIGMEMLNTPSQPDPYL
jgi:hypothetical protein